MKLSVPQLYRPHAWCSMCPLSWDPSTAGCFVCPLSWGYSAGSSPTKLFRTISSLFRFMFLAAFRL